jgi:hypothetical protein
MAEDVQGREAMKSLSNVEFVADIATGESVTTASTACYE